MSGGAAAYSASPAPPVLAEGAGVRPARPQHELWLAALFLLGLTLIALGWSLWGSGDRVLSNEDADLAMQFVPWRAFGFGQMRAGHLPLWNPDIFCGAPFLGGFQSALFYPPNWLYLILPLGRAINTGIALHVFLAGFFMYLWARGRALDPLACALAAVLFMFCGANFPHIYAGHLPNLCAMVWGPLIFLGIDEWLSRRTPGSILLGGGAVALQILAGHPQYVFYTGIAAGFYCLLGLFRTRRRGQAMAGLALIPLLGVALSAVQLLEGFHAAGTTLRSAGVSLTFASMFSFPPENFLTMIVPGFFGGAGVHPYWGRCAFWEMSLFFGLTGLVFAIYGVVAGRGGDRWRLLAVAGVLLLLALGAHTPLLAWLYWHVPGFGKFRGLSKFIYPASLFLILLAAVGFDALLAGGRPPAGLIASSAGVAVVLAACGWALLPRAGSNFGPDLMNRWMHGLARLGETFFSKAAIGKVAFHVNAARFAAHGMWLSAGTLLVLALLLYLGRRRRFVLAGVVALAAAEMLIFAYGTLETFSLAGAEESPASDYLVDHGIPFNDRILNMENPNLGMVLGRQDLWGYDPGVVRRYAEWMTFSQGISPDKLDENLSFSRVPMAYGSVLGCHYAFAPESMQTATHGLVVFTFPDVLVAPRLSLVSEAQIIPARNAIFSTLIDPGFDPKQTVILETPPEVAPVAGYGKPGIVELVSETCNTLTIDAELWRPAILVVADTFCSGWTIHSLQPPTANRGGQATYQILPADYCLRAVPLAAGHHHFEMTYRPLAFVIGAWISAITLALYLAALAWVGRDRFGRPRSA